MCSQTQARPQASLPPQAPCLPRGGPAGAEPPERPTAHIAGPAAAGLCAGDAPQPRGLSPLCRPRAGRGPTDPRRTRLLPHRTPVGSSDSPWLAEPAAPSPPPWCPPKTSTASPPAGRWELCHEQGGSCREVALARARPSLHRERPSQQQGGRRGQGRGQRRREEGQLRAEEAGAPAPWWGRGGAGPAPPPTAPALGLQEDPPPSHLRGASEALWLPDSGNESHIHRGLRQARPAPAAPHSWPPEARARGAAEPGCTPPPLRAGLSPRFPGQAAWTGAIPPPAQSLRRPAGGGSRCPSRPAPRLRRSEGGRVDGWTAGRPHRHRVRLRGHGRWGPRSCSHGAALGPGEHTAPRGGSTKAPRGPVSLTHTQGPGHTCSVPTPPP